MLVETNDLRPGVVQLKLNDPESRNAMSEAMAEEFSRAVQALQIRNDLQMLVLTGAGESFSGGGHLAMLLAKTRCDEKQNRESMLLFYSSFLSVRKIPVPVVAAINGHAIGAAACLTLACDIRIAVRNAKIGFNFVQIGLHPGMGATYFVPHIIGVAKARELLFTGRSVTADEALTLGLVSSVVEPGKLDESIEQIAQSICAASPVASRDLKRTWTDREERELNAALEEEARKQAASYASEDFRNRIAALQSKGRSEKNRSK